MSIIIWIAAALAALWFVGVVAFKLTSFLIHLVLIVALVLAAMWLFNKFTRSHT